MRMFLMVMVLALGGCTDTTSSKNNYEDPAEVKCYSGGKIIYEGASVGRVVSERGYYWKFLEKGSGDFVRITGECVVRN
jgi:hypothetical protein